MKINHLNFTQLTKLANSGDRLLKWRERALRRQWAGFGTREMFTVASAGWFFPEIRDAFSRVLALLESPELTEAAERAAKLTPIQPAKPGDDWQLLATFFPSSYSSQGYGASKYAECRAQILKHAVLLNFPNLPVRIREERKGYGDSHLFLVELLCAAESMEAVRMASFVSKREFVRLCWKFGCQPRVFLPYLPADYEKSEGLDYQGNEVPK